MVESRNRSSSEFAGCASCLDTVKSELGKKLVDVEKRFQHRQFFEFFQARTMIGTAWPGSYGRPQAPGQSFVAFPAISLLSNWETVAASCAQATVDFFETIPAHACKCRAIGDPSPPSEPALVAPFAAKHCHNFCAAFPPTPAVAGQSV